MTGPDWNADDPADAPLIAANAARLAAHLRSTAEQRSLPSLSLARDWHTTLYSGCQVPCADYVGNFRGDTRYPNLVGYEVGTAEVDAFGRNLWMGMYSARVVAELDVLERGFHRRLAALDALVPALMRPTADGLLGQVAVLAAAMHGEWIRIHPFANGNGRTARAWVYYVTARYGVPFPWDIKPRPADPAYARAARSSLGQAPDFVGDHRPTAALLAHRLQELLGTE